MTPGHHPALLAAALLAFGACRAPEPVVPRPDLVVLIVADTLRADHLGFHGYSRPTSPALDQWARRGAVFEQAMAPAPWTLPSVATVLTGLLPPRHQAGQRTSGGRTFTGLPGSVPQLPELFARAGWSTAGFATNRFLDRRFGFGAGFATWDQAPSGAWASRRARPVVDRALAWVEALAGDRGLVFLHFFDTHLPYDPPPRYRGRFTAGLETAEVTYPVRDVKGLRDRLPELSAADRAFVAAAYDEEVLFLTDQLGRLLAGLEQRQRLGRSLVLLTADHGEELFDHGGFEHGHSQYQELLHVPLVIWGPGVVAGRITAPVSLADVAPTLLDGAGLAAPTGLDGLSLWPAAQGDGALPWRRLAAAGNLYGPPSRALLAGPLKLLVEEHESGESRSRLFDLAADPGERIDLAPDRPREVATLGTLLDEALRPPGGHPDAEPATLDPEAEAELRSLGYLD